MATYRSRGSASVPARPEAETNETRLLEQPIYGSSRLGEYRPKLNSETESPTNQSGIEILGQRRYELSNHLGNLLAVVDDSKRFNETGETEAKVLAANDYYPYGAVMPGRSFNLEKYRYGFNGKENDKDFGKNHLIQDYGFRMYNPRIAKFLSVDPLKGSYPFYTPYQFAGNTPIQAIDVDGAEPLIPRLHWRRRPKLTQTWTDGGSPYTVYKAKGKDENGNYGSDLWIASRSGKNNTHVTYWRSATGTTWRRFEERKIGADKDQVVTAMVGITAAAIAVPVVSHAGAASVLTIEAVGAAAVSQTSANLLVRFGGGKFLANPLLSAYIGGTVANAVDPNPYADYTPGLPGDEVIGNAIGNTARAAVKANKTVSSAAQVAGQGARTSSKIPTLGKKLDFVFGKATGNSHNIQRSTDMLRNLNRVGIQDNAAGRALLKGHLNQTFNSAKGITQSNGRVLRESFLMGPQGGLQVNRIWEGDKLITIMLKGGG